MHLTAIPGPDGAYELLVLVAIAYEGEAPSVTEGSKDYLRRLGENPSDITEAIADAAYAELFRAAAPTHSGSDH